MQANKKLLSEFGLFENLPQEFKSLDDKLYFVFYYTVLEDEAVLYIHSFEVVQEVNISLYRRLNEKNQSVDKQFYPLKIGYFSNQVETRDGLFYQFLRTYNDSQAVSRFYAFAASQDKLIDINISTNSDSVVLSSEDFKRIISYFCYSRFQIISQVYDMVAEAIKNRLSKNLYGDMIKQVVNLLTYEGGVVPEIDGTFRYMVIGQKADLNETQKVNLYLAKNLIRKMVSFDEVYMKTEWALGQKDGKWRTNIADNDAKILTDKLYDVDGRKLYIPDGSNAESVLQFIKNKELISSSSYNGKLIDILYHPILYSHYPQLALLPIFYFYGDKGGRGDFYFSDNEAGGYILMDGSKQHGNSLSILLHEVQHAIQHKEGFSRGGNLFLARFVASIGSNAVKRVFACISKVEGYFRDYLLNDESRNDLLSLIKNTTTFNNNTADIKAELIKLLSREDAYTQNYTTINFYLIIFSSEIGEDFENEFISILESKGINLYLLYEVFSNVKDGYQQSKQYQQKLLSEGFNQKDINNILFEGYRNLYGEMESRSVQSSRFVESQFRNYFFLTKWERTPIKQLTVIDGRTEIVDTEKIKAAVEAKDGEYVLHFKRGTSCIPYLHELGHIVKDCLFDLGYKNELVSQFGDDLYTSNFDEWFVDMFLAYLKNKLNNKELNYDLRLVLLKENKVISDILNNFFYDDGYSERLNFLQQVLSIS